MNAKHLFVHDWAWDIVTHYPLTIRQVCVAEKCKKVRPTIKAKVLAQRQTQCQLCENTVTIWRTYSDGQKACLECVSRGKAKW